MKVTVTENSNDQSIIVTLDKCPCCGQEHSRVVHKDCSQLSMGCPNNPGWGHVDIWLKHPEIDPNAPPIEFPPMSEVHPQLITQEITKIQPMEPLMRDILRRRAL